MGRSGQVGDIKKEEIGGVLSRIGLLKVVDRLERRSWKHALKTDFLFT